MGFHTVISQFALIQNAAPALVHNIGYPNATDTKALLLASLQELIPQRFI